MANQLAFLFFRLGMAKSRGLGEYVLPCCTRARRCVVNSLKYGLGSRRTACPLAFFSELTGHEKGAICRAAEGGRELEIVKWLHRVCLKDLKDLGISLARRGVRNRPHGAERHRHLSMTGPPLEMLGFSDDALPQRPVDPGLQVSWAPPPLNGEGAMQPANAMAQALPDVPPSSGRSTSVVVSIDIDPQMPFLGNSRPAPSQIESQVSVDREPSETTVSLGSLSKPRGKFSLHSELMHVFVCYRVVSEGPTGNGLSGTIAQRIRELSLEELQLPRHGWGIWPKGATQPVPFRPEEAKVFLDRDCLQDGQSWLAGFVQGLAASMVFVPLLSWTEADLGSVGEMSRIGVAGFDRIDNVPHPQP